jgi:excisionase family DNA binding protein
MRRNQPLAVTMDHAAQLLGVGRSTAYELVCDGNLKCIRLRRRIVVPVTHLAERLGVDREAVWAVLRSTAVDAPPCPPSPAPSRQSGSCQPESTTVETPSLF